MDERLQKQLNFILEIDKEKNIFRQTHLSRPRPPRERRRSTHGTWLSWRICCRNIPTSRWMWRRVMLMCLLHDVVEIDAGDTYAYDTDGLEDAEGARGRPQSSACTRSCRTTRSRRAACADLRRIRSRRDRRRRTLPTRWTISSRSCSTTANGGSDWADHDVTAKQVYGRQSRTEKGSAYLYKLTDNILQANIKKGALKEK